ncbi:MAG TPA: class I adenylate-forming enzyme family protein [Mycobacteriales bacterium]|nr:class I adenylate-forming enzyme family protein [Mycobacteriales bacterium]
MLIDLLRASADRDPDRPLVVTDARSVSVAEVLAESKAVAAQLSRRGIPRIGCLIDDVASLVAVICGAAAAGTEICVLPTYLDAGALDELVASLGHPAVVVESGHRPAGADLLSLGEVTAPLPGSVSATEPDPGLLILTTGTTGQPKATHHKWSRLVSGVASDHGATWLLTYNVNQFAGIQLLLHVIVNDGTVVVPASRRPTDVIEAIGRHGITHVSGTPTFWRLLLVQTDEAFPVALEQITLGGEVVPADLLDRLHQMFPDTRITHIYAGTEFGSVIAVSDGLPGLPMDLLSRGEGGRAQLKVVDGELHVRSSVGMISYVGGSDVTTEWIATGDLVEVVGDRAMFVGRINDRINVAGTKVSPHAIEEAVYAVDGVELAAAYGKPNPITGSIVVVDVVASPGQDLDALKQAIRAGCAKLPLPARPRLIRFVDALDRRGGKTLRGVAPTNMGVSR